MKPGDLVRNKNSESGELGLFVGWHDFKNSDSGDTYTCAEVYWHDRNAVCTIKKGLIEVVNEKRRHSKM